MAFFGRDFDGMNDEDGRVLLRTIVLWSIATSSVTGALGLLSSGQWSYVPFLLMPIAFQLATLWALKVFKPHRVGAVYLVLVTSFFFLGGFIDHGTSGQAYHGLVLVVQAAVLLYGLHGLAVVLPLSLVIGLALALAELNGQLGTPPVRTPIEGILAPFGAFVLTGAGSWVVHQRLRRAVGQAQAQALVTAKANTQLSHEIERRRQMEQELHDSMERALEASRLKSSFLANVSHELRTPMNAVVGLTDLMLTDQRVTEAQREALETIRGSSDALLALLDDILDLSKIESGAMEFESLPTAVGAIVEEVRKLLTARAGIRGIGLRTEVAPEVPAQLLLDPTRLRQVLLNLVGNAIKFTPQGEVVIRATWADEQLRLEVSDTGIGIPAEHVERIFQPFVQADASTTRRFGGTGLGLTIVHRLVDAQGGAITVRSEAGKGSTFTVTLPAKATRRNNVSSGSLPVVPDASFARLAVLLAEDNPINEKVALKLLEHLGVKAEVARNGREAVELCADRQFDLVLMDIQMPELDGLAATRILRERHGARLRIAAMTANAMTEDRARAKEAGCDDFVAKPVRLEDLQKVLSRAVKARATAA
jgi:signal transduction histidine kinase/ActR/RegA family two-component response regulator